MGGEAGARGDDQGEGGREGQGEARVKGDGQGEGGRAIEKNRESNRTKNREIIGNRTNFARTNPIRLYQNESIVFRNHRISIFIFLKVQSEKLFTPPRSLFHSHCSLISLEYSHSSHSPPNSSHSRGVHLRRQAPN